VYEEEWSKVQNGRHILREVEYFDEHSHEFKDINRIEAKKMEKTICGVHMKDITNIEQSWTLR
jgi:hypothetical protein